MAKIVYEIMNETLKEHYVGSANLSIDELKNRHKETPPRAVLHWDFKKHRLLYREIETGMSDSRYRAFVGGYLKSVQREGWKVLVG